jgi:hypothetical protein
VCFSVLSGSVLSTCQLLRDPSETIESESARALEAGLDMETPINLLTLNMVLRLLSPPVLYVRASSSNISEFPQTLERKG